MYCLLYCGYTPSRLTEVLHVQHQVYLLNWETWNSLSSISPDLPSLKHSKVLLGSAVSSASQHCCWYDMASRLSSGSSKLVNNGHIPEVNTSVWREEGKIASLVSPTLPEHQLAVAALIDTMPKGYQPCSQYSDRTKPKRLPTMQSILRSTQSKRLTIL